MVTKLLATARALRQRGETHVHQLLYALVRGMEIRGEKDEQTKSTRLDLVQQLQSLERLRQMEVFLVWLDLLMRRGKEE